MGQAMVWLLAYLEISWSRLGLGFGPTPTSATTLYKVSPSIPIIWSKSGVCSSLSLVFCEPTIPYMELIGTMTHTNGFRQDALSILCLLTLVRLLGLEY